MATVQSRPQMAPRTRSLRVGIILGGKIVEEKLIRKREQITIGQSAKNTFSVPVEGVPRQWPLFVVKDDKYYLNFNDAMDGRISDGGQVHPLATLKGGGAQRIGEGWVLPLPDSARGKIVLGDMTLLFQFVTAPPLQPRPHLPASVRGTLADRIDPHLAVIAAISIVAHMSIMIYARSCHDPPKKRVDRIYEETFPEEYQETFDQPQAVQVDVDVGKQDQTEQPAKEEPKEDKKPAKTNKPDKGDSGDKGTPRPKKSDEELAQEADLAIAQMFADDSSESGNQGTKMSDRNPGNRLSEEAANVEEGRVKVTLKDQGDQGPSRTKRTRASTSGPNVDTGGPGRENSGEVGPAKVPKKPSVDVSKPDVDEKTSLTPAEIMNKIRRQYSYGLKQCFKRVLKLDENASGTERLRFTIGERGNVTKAQTKGFGYDTLDKCVEDQAMTWRFSPPKDSDGDPTSITVTLALPFTGK